MAFSADKEVRYESSEPELPLVIIPPLFSAQDPLVPDGTFIHRENGGRL